MIHTINLTGYSAIPVDCRALILGTAKSYGIEQLQIITDYTWAGLAITATFVTATGAVKMLVDPDGTVKVPPEATANPTNAIQSYIVFVGVADGVQRISCDLPYRVRDHVPIDGVASKPTPNEWQQYIAETQKIINKAVPQEGNVGQVLTKTADGSEWSDLTGGGTGSDGVQIDDSVISTDFVWSSRNTVDRLTSEFNQKAPIVQGELVADYPMAVKSYIRPIQDGSGDPSPDNVRPIRSVTEIKTIKCGRNLLNLDGREIVANLPFPDTSKRELNGNKLFVGISGNNYFANDKILSYSVIDNVVQVSSKGSAYGIGFDIPVVPGMQLKFSSKKSSFNAFVRIGTYSKDGVYKRTQDGSASELNITIADGEYWVVIVFGSEANKECTYNNIQLELNSTFTAYEPYHGEIYTQTLPEEVYGGIYEWDTGKLTVTQKKQILTGEEDWRAFPKNDYGAYIYHAQFEDCKPGYFTSLCSHFTNFQSAWNTKGKWYYSDNQTIVSKYFNTSFENASEWKNYLAQQKVNGTPVTLVYQLQTPRIIQLPKHLILSKLGITTVYSDSGDTEVTARQCCEVDVPESTISYLKGYTDKAKNDAFAHANSVSGNALQAANRYTDEKIASGEFNGKSAYEIAVENGFIGSEQQWVESLKGNDGKTPEKGVDYWTNADQQSIVNDVLQALPKWNGGVF